MKPRPPCGPVLLVVALLSTVPAARAQPVALTPVSVTAASVQGQGCSEDPAYAALDFWVGEWEVSAGERVGENRIEKLLKGCAIMEHWTDVRGGEGKSLFYFVPALAEWRQVWVTDAQDVPGGVKEKALVERLEGGGVRFQGDIPVPGGGSYLDRTTLTPQPDGTVRQLIERSVDGGTTWQSSFDAVYRRRLGP